MRDSVVFYRSFWEAIKKLSDEDKLEALTAIIEYGLNGVEPKTEGVAAAMFLMAKPQIDANNKRYQNGTKGGRPITKEEPNNNQSITKPKPKEKVKENVKEKENNNAFCPEVDKSTLDERIVASFLLNDGSMYNVTENDLKRFQELYPGIDCMQQLRNITGWCEGNPNNRKTRTGAKRFLNSWMAREQNKAPVKSENAKPKTSNRFNNFDQRQHDYDDIVFGEIRRRANASDA